jgi:hypothetical protein
VAQFSVRPVWPLPSPPPAEAATTVGTGVYAPRRSTVGDNTPSSSFPCTSTPASQPHPHSILHRTEGHAVLFFRPSPFAGRMFFRLPASAACLQPIAHDREPAARSGRFRHRDTEVRTAIAQGRAGEISKRAGERRFRTNPAGRCRPIRSYRDQSGEKRGGRVYGTIRARSASTVLFFVIPKFSWRTASTPGETKAGSFGPRAIFFTPRLSRARSTSTAFCSYQAML